MKISVKTVDDVIVVQLQGRLNHLTSPDTQEQLTELIKQGAKARREFQGTRIYQQRRASGSSFHRQTTGTQRWRNSYMHAQRRCQGGIWHLGICHDIELVRRRNRGARRLLKSACIPRKGLSVDR
jgi:hypothetical protein